MNMDAVKRYIELRRQMLAIEADLEALKPAVAAHLREQGQAANLDGYELMLRTYTAWTYSPEVASLQTTLNEAKRQERQNGRAAVRERRDMLVLRSSRAEAPVVRETPDAADEWEADDARPAAWGS